jgi:XTP/dITP diphosphohydrolase
VRVVLATANPDKAREIAPLLAEVDVIPRPPSLPEIEETGATLEDNARLKARVVCAATGEIAVADDTGLEVDALGGAPGVYSARYSGPHATDEANNRLLLENLRGAADRTARFVCAIALVESGAVRGVWRGAVEGRIIDEARGGRGFGYDPLFFYPPYGCTFGEADDAAKFAVSHRGQALRAMLNSI